VIRFQMDVLAADQVERTIEGVVVPFNKIGRIAGVDYRFLPGSVRCARARTPLLLDHDRSRPVGVLAAITETDAGMVGRFAIDNTPDGTLALAQAASGSRGAFSIGATVEASLDNSGVIEVTAGLVHEVSLLALGAFDGAYVEHVAAEADDEPAPAPAVCESCGQPLPAGDDDDQGGEHDGGADDPDADSDPNGGTMPDQTTDAAAAPAMIIAARDRAPRELTAGEYVHALLAAQHGDDAARRTIEAALTETISTDIPGLLPPSYESSVIGPSPVDRVLYDTFRGKPLPGVGLTIQKPQWTTLPDGAWAANVDADATTGKAVIGLNPAAIERWDWATAISYTAVKRSSPDAINTIYAAAVQNFYLDVEVKIATLLDTTAGTPNAAIKAGAGIAAFYTRCGRAPEVIIVAPDVWGLLADAGALTLPWGAAGAALDAGVGGLRAVYAGLPIVSSAALAAGTKYLATRRALDVRITDPAQLTANAIGALNVELGVVGEGLFDADVPLEVMELAAGAPVGLDATTGKAAKS